GEVDSAASVDVPVVGVDLGVGVGGFVSPGWHRPASTVGMRVCYRACTSVIVQARAQCRAAGAGTSPTPTATRFDSGPGASPGIVRPVKVSREVFVCAGYCQAVQRRVIAAGPGHPRWPGPAATSGGVETYA